jgi:hypothetical protein
MSKPKRQVMTAAILVPVLAMLVSATAVVADDGEMFRKNVSNTPDLETEFASIRMLPLSSRYS